MSYIQYSEVKSFSRVQLCGPMDCSPPGSSTHGIFQARVGASRVDCGVGKRHGSHVSDLPRFLGMGAWIRLCGQRDAFAGFPPAELNCFSGTHLFLAAPPCRQSVVTSSCGVASLGQWPSSHSMVPGSSLASSWPLPIPT